MQIFHLEASTPRPGHINGVFKEDRSFTMMGAKKYIKNLKNAIAKVQEQNFIINLSTPDSTRTSKFLAIGDSDSSGAAQASQVNLMEHSGTDAGN